MSEDMHESRNELPTALRTGEARAVLRRVVIERTADGWSMVREMGETGDRWTCDDLLEATEILHKGFRPDGTLRVTQRQGTEQEKG